MLEGWVRHTTGDFSLDVHWSVAKGQVLAIVGPSGSGKTMTLRTMAGLIRPCEGRLFLSGRVLYSSEDDVWVPPHEREVGYVPQSYGLFPHLSVRENVAFGVRGESRVGCERIVGQSLETFRIDDVADRRPNTLSGGQRQRVALARALAPEPRALLLDEPFASLDFALRHELRRELLSIKERTRIPVVLVTHDSSDAVAMADLAIVLEDGHVVDEGQVLDVMDRPRARNLSQVTEVQNVFEGVVSEVSEEEGLMTCDLGPVSIVSAYNGQKVGDRARIGIRAGDVLVAIKSPVGISAQNVLPGVISVVRDAGFERRLSVDCNGVTFSVEVTPRAVAQLGLRPGTDVWLVLKSSSCFALD